MGENVEVGIYDTQVALKMAQDQELDLVEISPPLIHLFVKLLTTTNSSTIRRRKKKR